MNQQTISPNLMATIKKAQVDEETGAILYAFMALREKDGHNQKILQQMAADEKTHAETWRRYTGEKLRPKKSKILWLKMLTVILGFTFVLKTLEKDEQFAEEAYLKTVSYTHLAAAMTEVAGVVSISRVVDIELSGTQIAIYGSQPAISRDIIQPYPLHFDFGLSVPKIEKSARAAHDAKSAGSDNIYLFGCLFDANIFGDMDNFFGSDNHCLSSTNFGIYLFIRFHQQQSSFSSIANGYLFRPAASFISILIVGIHAIDVYKRQLLQSVKILDLSNSS